MAVLCPSPLVTAIATPGTWFKICWGCMGPVRWMARVPMTPTDAGACSSRVFSRLAVTVISLRLGGSGVAGAATGDKVWADAVNALKIGPANASAKTTQFFRMNHLQKIPIKYAASPHQTDR
jgi:hypothetical protein